MKTEVLISLPKDRVFCALNDSPRSAVAAFVIGQASVEVRVQACAGCADELEATVKSHNAQMPEEPS
jgi:hypothetical protein